MTDLANGSQVRITQPGVRSGIYVLEGPKGTPGRAVSSIARTSGTGAAGTVDTYTITYSDATTTTYQVTNGANGRSVSSIARTAGNGAAGTTDTYTITYSDATTSTFTVVNGTNGTNGTNGQGVPIGGTAGQVLQKVSGTNYDTTWANAAAGGGAIIARTSYNPATPTDTRTSTSFTWVDVANLSVTFTPTTTSVDVTLEGCSQVTPTSTTTSCIASWGLAIGASEVGEPRIVAYSDGKTSISRLRVAIRVTGLTVGVEVTVRWRLAKSDNGSGTAWVIHGGADRGPSIMEVRPA